ncbi:META domain-containing protein [Cellulomonas hominis]
MGTLREQRRRPTPGVRPEQAGRRAASRPGRPAAVRRPTAVLSGLALLATLAACASGPDVDGPWLLSSGTVEGEPLRLLDHAPVTLDIDGGTISGRAACNGYGGEVDTDDGWSLVYLALEEAACAPEVMAVESAYTAALGSVTAAVLDDDVLVLTGEDVRLRFVSRPEPAAD